ncbi:MAG: DUF4199 domain-containing protein [Bacteroidota bacterium]
MTLNSLIIRYGLYAAAVIIGFGILSFLFMGEINMENMKMGEITGYASIILSLGIFLFLGLRKFRDELNGGNLSFLQALKVGVMIVLIPSIGFGAYNHVYAEWLDPDFTEKYYQHHIDQLEDQLSPAEFQAEKAKLESQKDMFMNPFLSFVLMFLTVFLIGVVLTILIAFILKKETVEVSSLA